MAPDSGSQLLDEFKESVDLATRAHKKIEKKFSGEEVGMLERLHCKALIAEAYMKYAIMNKETEEFLEEAKPSLEMLEHLDEKVGIEFDYKAKKFKRQGAENAEPDSDGDDFGEDEHENAAVREFMSAYRAARRGFFSILYALEPKKTLDLKTAYESAKRLGIARSFYSKIPERVRNSKRTRRTAGQALKEIDWLLDHLERFVDEYQEQLQDADD